MYWPWLFLPKASKTSTSYRRFQMEHVCGAEKAPAPRSVEGRYRGMMNQLLDELSVVIDHTLTRS
jgi:hypothetical protein